MMYVIPSHSYEFNDLDMNEVKIMLGKEDEVVDSLEKAIQMFVEFADQSIAEYYTLEDKNPDDLIVYTQIIADLLNANYTVDTVEDDPDYEDTVSYILCPNY